MGQVFQSETGGYDKEMASVRKCENYCNVVTSHQ